MTREDTFERALRESLHATASAVRPEPDEESLSRRITRDARRRRTARRGSLAVVALLVAGGGVRYGQSLVNPHTAHVSLTSNDAGEGGLLPTGPTPTGTGTAKGLVRLGTHLGVLARPSSYRASAADGIELEATGSWMAPVVVRGGTGAGCYAGELVSTLVSSGDLETGALGVVGLAPLAPGGLEVVDSGTASVSPGEDVWWATVAVGTGVARVAAEAPGGGTDVTRPHDGLAVVAGTAPVADTMRFLSVVAETASGQSSGSLGFLAGFGSRARGTAASGSETTGCRAASAPSRARAASLLPSGRLLAASGVLAAFQSAYDGRLPGGPDETVSAVAGGQGLLAGKARPGSTDEVQVAEVRLVREDEAAAVYRVDAGGWETGEAVLGPDGVWRLTAGSYCSALLSLKAGAVPIPGSLQGCERVLGVG